MAKNPSKDIELPFPVQGIQEVGPHSKQPPMSTHGSKNVVPFDTEEGRMRGGRRRGIDVASNNTGGRIQLLDEMKVPAANISGFTGGEVPYNGSSGTYDGVANAITSNISNILRDPNQDQDVSDSREGQGPISYIGPSNLPNDPTIPIDMYETTTIWPTAASWDGTYTPMKSTVITDDDIEGNHLSTKYKTDGSTSSLPVVTDGGAIKSLDASTGNINEGVWSCKEIDGKNACIYPKPPFDTDGSPSNPGKSSAYHPTAANLDYYVDASGLAGKHVSSALFPAADFTEDAYVSGVENTKNWAMSASIKTPAATPPAFGSTMSGTKRDNEEFTLGTNSRGVALKISSWKNQQFFIAGTESSDGTTHYVRGKGDKKLYALSVNNDVTGSNNTTSGTDFANKVLFSKDPIKIGVIDGRSVTESYYGFLFRTKATIDIASKTVDVSAETPGTDDMLFVGFHDSPSVQEGGNDNSTSEKPKLIIGKVSNKKSSTDTPLADQEALFVTDVYEATGSQLPEFEHASWYDLEVRYIDGDISVTLGGTDAIPFSREGGESITRLTLSDYLGVDAAANSIELSRARSGLVYYSTRLMKPPTITNPTFEASEKAIDINHGLFYSRTSTNLWTVGTTNLPGFDPPYAGLPRNYYISNNYVIKSVRPDGTLEIWMYLQYDGDAQIDARPGYVKGYFQLLEDDTYDNTYQQSGSFKEPNGNSSNRPGTTTVSMTPEAAASDGTYVHKYTSDSVSNLADRINSSGGGADWVREWSPAYFHNVTWRYAEANAAADSTKLTVAVAGGVPKISGDASESFVGLQGGADASLNLSATSPRVGGTIMFDRYYLVDGTKYLLIDTPKREIFDWSSMTSKDDGTTYLIPGGQNGQSIDTPRCRLITSWLGRIVMAGKNDEPNNWFMSAIASTTDYNANPDTAVGANDWDLAATDTEGLGAIAGNSSNLAEIGDPITSLFAYRDTALVFGCTGSIFMLTGDPGPPESGAEILTLSKDIGIVSADAWCYGPNRSLYFFGQNGLYRMAPNEFNVDQSNRISSGRLDKTFASIDASRFDISLHYDYHTYGVHIFLHNKNTPTTLMESHYYYDERSDSLWEMEYPALLGPSAALSYNHINPEKRRILLGGYDGVVRYFSDLAQYDNATSGATAIDSFVWVGPIAMDGFTEAKLMRIAAVLDEQSANLDYAVHVGDTAESAKNSDAVITGTWSKGRNNHSYTRARGQSIFVKLSSSLLAVPWAMETITARIAVAGRSRDRG